jgi:hypothetical protein
MVRKRKIILSILLLLALIGFIGWITYLFTPTHPISREQAYALFAREVPLGSSRIEIENWIASKNWGKRYGYYPKRKSEDDYWFKGNPEYMTGYVSCYIEDNSRKLTTGSGDLVLIFYLDKDDKLIQVYYHQYSNSL